MQIVFWLLFCFPSSSFRFLQFPLPVLFEQNQTKREFIGQMSWIWTIKFPKINHNQSANLADSSSELTNVGAAR